MMTIDVHYPADGYEPAETIAKPIEYISVYRMERHYSGPEEGGQWWNSYSLVCSVPLLKAGCVAEFSELASILEPRFPDVGDMYSVAGGHAYIILGEHCRGHHEQTSAPSYQ